jgi:uncharacterized protein
LCYEDFFSFKVMIYNDRIYGAIEINEPVILELISSPEIQRLKGIDQVGYFEPYYPETSHKRFEHSLGVFILLKKFGAFLEEQIAGLIHDVSHGVFSHCIDYILAEGSPLKHNHQDNVFHDFVKKSGIPSILGKHKIDTDYILDEKNFPLKEQELPDLCADRIDYSLRTGVIYGEIEKNNVDYFLGSLEVRNNKWIFKNFESAKKYAELFSKLNTVYYSGLSSAVMFQTVGDCVKYALEKKYISRGDLYTVDENVLSKIKDNLEKDEKLDLLWKRMNGKVGYSNNPENYDARVFCKSRIVDPFCVHQGRIQHLSDIDRDWKKVVEQESKPKEYFIKFEK